MGWGERRLTTSERITARRQVDGASRDLAASVATFLVSGTTANAEAMHRALQAYTEARSVLDG